jgi:hypothetical protein
MAFPPARSGLCQSVARDGRRSRKQRIAELQFMAYLYRRRNKAAAHCGAVAREVSMKQTRSSRQLIKVWHRREKATIEHLVRMIGGGKAVGTTHSPFTASGHSVEDQVRKAWQPSPGGLAIF